MEKKLSELLNSKKAVTGYEVEVLINKTLQPAPNNFVGHLLGELDLAIARDLSRKYFSNLTDSSYKPLKFVYYNVEYDEIVSEFVLKRNLVLSPRAFEYFDKNATFDTSRDGIRDIITNKKSVLGRELKELVSESKNITIQEEYDSSLKLSEINMISFDNLTKQLADYIDEYFISCEKPIKDDIWYGVVSKEYGTATVYRNLTLSPRNTK